MIGMEFEQVLKSRYSERSYHNEKPPKEIIRKIIESALLAPNSCNLQVMQFVVVDDEKLQKKLANIATRKILWAPVNIFILHDRRFSRKRSSGIMSAGAALQNMCLTATSLGLATCPMAGFSGDREIRKILKIPKHFEILLILSVGYPQSEGRVRAKVSINDVLTYNSFEAKNNYFESSLDIKAWSLNKLTNYRARIGPVYRYGNRFSLSVYDSNRYKSAANFLLKKANFTKITDLFTYDGLFIKELKALTDKKELSVTVTDSVQYILSENKSSFSGSDSSVIDSEYKTDILTGSQDVVTVVHKLQFTPEPLLLIAEGARILKSGGLMLIVVDNPYTYKNITRLFLAKVVSKLIPFRLNVYEQNTYYKIGPRLFLNFNQIKNYCFQNKLKLIDKNSVIISRGLQYEKDVYAIFRKD